MFNSNLSEADFEHIHPIVGLERWSAPRSKMLSHIYWQYNNSTRKRMKANESHEIFKLKVIE